MWNISVSRRIFLERFEPLKTHILISFNEQLIFKNLEMSDLNQTLHARSYDINHYF